MIVIGLTKYTYALLKAWLISQIYHEAGMPNLLIKFVHICPCTISYAYLISLV